MAKKIDLNKRSQNSAYTGDLSLDPSFFDPIESSAGIIVRQNDGSIVLAEGIQLSSVGIYFDDSLDLPEDQFIALGELILNIKSAFQFIVGDYFAFGAKRDYGARTQVAERLGVNPDTITNWTSVCRSIEYTRRRVGLEFGHHEAVASLSPRDQDYWLEKALIGNSEEGDKYRRWSVKRLRQELADSHGKDTLPIPSHIKWADQSEDRAAKVLSLIRKAKSEKQRSTWIEFAKSEAERWARVVSEIEE